MKLTVSAADSPNRDAALRLLFAHFPVEEQVARLRDALLASEQGRLNLDGLLLATAGEMPVGAALVMLQPDRIALVWPPVVSCGAVDEAAVEDALMFEVCRRIDAADARLGQALLSPEDAVEAELLARHGFAHAADLFFLARALQPSDAELSAADSHDESLLAGRNVITETFHDDNASRFAAVIEQSYQHSLDCASLKDFRTGAEALASHKLSGEFDPSGWLLYSIDDRDAGVLLLNEHPDQDAIELAYIGVTPELRGLRLGRRMLREGVRLAAQRGCAAMFLAVDCKNSFANAVYGELSFAELARRRILLRHPYGLARQ
ncbi:MAG: GNAT family N-acetyltransferase [Candidatus Saccharimonas sp.]|nr:GNAT family N-acetyltransferase [Planctomycetaceae bacterium]